MKTTRVVSERLELGEGESKLVVLVDREEGKPPEDVSIQSSWGSVTLPLETLLRVSQAARDWNGFARICPDHGTYADADGVKPYGECPKCASEKAKAETPPSPTCSECRGPLDEEAVYGAGGTARCSACHVRDEALSEEVAQHAAARREAEARARETAELAVDVRRERAKDGRVCP